MEYTGWCENECNVYAYNQAESQMNKDLVDSKIPGDLWRGLKEAGCLRSDAPTPGNTDGKL
jgi:hypothetical protein